MPRQKISDGRLVVSMRPTDLVKLDALARRRDISRAQLVREMIRDGLTELLRPVPADQHGA